MNRLFFLLCFSSTLFAQSDIKTDGPWFIDNQGGVIIYRGVNVSGEFKTPPFTALSEADLDVLPSLGFNLVRLIFNWEAYEPVRGKKNEGYLDWLAGMAKAANARGMHVFVDFHQDGFSRYVTDGCGEGFPRWAVPSFLIPDVPDNSARCRWWSIKSVLNSKTNQAVNHFYNDTDKVRTNFLEVWKKIATRFKDIPGVIGYELLNEPLGNEEKQISPLFEDTAKVIRAVDPNAILFIEPFFGLATRKNNLLKPTFSQFVFAPHVYDNNALITYKWKGETNKMETAFKNMVEQSKKWNVPVLVGEFGITPQVENHRGLMEYMQYKMNENFLSNTFWQYGTHWHPVTKDNWNGEDFILIDNNKQIRTNYRVRPYAKRISGKPQLMREFHKNFKTTGFFLKWHHVPSTGETIVFAPESSFSGKKGTSLTVTGQGIACKRLDLDHVSCSSELETDASLHIKSSK